MTAKLIKRAYPADVRAKLDPTRPKYNEAVKSLAAFCEKANDPELVFKVLVTHLDAACKEVKEEEFLRLGSKWKVKHGG
jgi:hypothetical protein